MFHNQMDCIICKRAETINKVPNFVLKRAPEDAPPSRTGKVVDEFIKDARKELEEQRRDLKTEHVDK